MSEVLTAKKLEELKKSFPALNTRRRTPKEVPCGIVVDGKRVSVSNGKAVWRRIRDAKLAIRNHLESRYWTYGEPGIKYATIDQIMKEMVGVGPDFPIQIIPLETTND